MERGTIEQTLLQEHCVDADKRVSPSPGLSNIVAGVTSLTTTLCLLWRSGDEVSDGGHMTVPSIGQAMRSSTKVAVSSATDRLGKAHIDPMT